MLFDASVASVLAVMVAHAVSPVLEEILFRGFLLDELMAKLAFWRANTVTRQGDTDRPAASRVARSPVRPRPRATN